MCTTTEHDAMLAGSFCGQQNADRDISKSGSITAAGRLYCSMHLYLEPHLELVVCLSVYDIPHLTSSCSITHFQIHYTLH
jgi:hypothetical protein